MPKIDVNAEMLFRFTGRTYGDDELGVLLECAKAEIDEPAGPDGVLKIELNDTNRPDLWSTAGLARQLRSYGSGSSREYGFFSTPEAARDHGDRIVTVDPALREIRPYVAGFVAAGKPIEQVVLDDVIQTQEKLCWNYGRKRKSIAMGVYRSDLMKFPVSYTAVGPDEHPFVPLGMDEPMTPARILELHPKGKEFGGVLEGLSRYPFLLDATGDVLSFPPIINSAQIGAVEAGDERLFVELTGTDLPSLLVACSIVACDMADAGYTIEPVLIEYPYDTAFGRTITTPFRFQDDCRCDLSYIARLLGRGVSGADAKTALGRMGVAARDEAGTIVVTPPPYRNDFLHAVDVVEDVAIGSGLDAFAPAMPSDATVGRLSEVEVFSRRVKGLMVGLGFQEMIFNYLGSVRDYVVRMYPEDEHERVVASMIGIANPMSENFESVRPSILPSLLAAESVSAHAQYPHHVFELGKTVVRDSDDVYGSRTLDQLGFLSADADVGFNSVSAHVTAILFFLGFDFAPQEMTDSRFIPGRAAAIVVNGSRVGCFGEIHPRVLENWGIQVPCTGCEIDLNAVLSIP